MSSNVFEIKFRVWNPNKKHFMYWGFLEVDFLSVPTGFSYDYLLSNSQQFINKCDRNNKDIYVGDIVDISRFNNPESVFRVLIKDIRYIPQEFYGSNFNWCEVVGNICENPEMISSF